MAPREALEQPAAERHQRPDGEYRGQQPLDPRSLRSHESTRQHADQDRADAEEQHEEAAGQHHLGPRAAPRRTASRTTTASARAGTTGDHGVNDRRDAYAAIDARRTAVCAARAAAGSRSRESAMVGAEDCRSRGSRQCGRTAGISARPVHPAASGLAVALSPMTSAAPTRARPARPPLRSPTSRVRGPRRAGRCPGEPGPTPVPAASATPARRADPGDRDPGRGRRACVPSRQACSRAPSPVDRHRPRPALAARIEFARAITLRPSPRGPRYALARMISSWQTERMPLVVGRRSPGTRTSRSEIKGSRPLASWSATLDQARAPPARPRSSIACKRRSRRSRTRSATSSASSADPVAARTRGPRDLDLRRADRAHHRHRKKEVGRVFVRGALSRCSIALFAQQRGGATGESIRNALRDEVATPPEFLRSAGPWLFLQAILLCAGGNVPEGAAARRDVGRARCGARPRDMHLRLSVLRSADRHHRDQQLALPRGRRI